MAFLLIARRVPQLGERVALGLIEAKTA